MPTPRKPWTRDELLVAFNLYCRTPFGRLHHGNPDIIALAQRIGRSPGSVAMKLCNFASLDPIHRRRKIAGLKNASAADRQIFAEFDADWQSLAATSELAAQRLKFRPLDLEPGSSTSELAATAAETETIRTVRTRRMQSLFRATVLAGYDMACAISGINIPALLQASHIIPWSREVQRRLDPRNGIALSALHDRAFDRGLITFDDQLRVAISPKLRVKKPTDLHRQALLSIEGQPLRLPTRYAPDPAALDYHRQHIFAA